MKLLAGVVSGTGLLIGLYLVLEHGGPTVSIFGALSDSYVKGVKALQGH